MNYLRKHGCERTGGRWMQGDLVLASDPVESARLLRRRLIQQELDRTRAAGRWCHR
ncbi:MAG: hypothetical protein IPK63_19460 [Candidatus Competibacteraceae bacterium]|nr:hypothetical protein [Candidatus Competibacteraceae bacterium]